MNKDNDDVFGSDDAVNEAAVLVDDTNMPDLPEKEEVVEEDKPIKRFNYVNPNVSGGQWCFAPVDRKASPFKYQIPLAMLNHTLKEADELTKDQYYGREDATFNDEWIEAIRLSQEDNITGSFFGDSLNRKGSDWGVKVSHEGHMLGAGRPRAKASGDGEKIVGLKAVSKIQELLGLGGMIKVPLWHSGLYVSIKNPTDIQLLNFYETIAREKIELGKTTAGLVFTNSSSYVNSAIYDLIVDCIYETSVKDVATGDLKDIIKMNDFPILAWALAFTIYPNGYSYIRPCIVNPESCQHVIEALLDIGKLLWVDRSSLNEKQRRHMSVIPRKQATKAEVLAYQAEFENSEDNLYDTDNGISIAFKQPTISEHLDSGTRWIEELDEIVRDVFSDEVKQDNINRYISERASLTKLRNYAHYIKHINFTDDNSSADETETLERLLNQLSASPDVVEGLVTKLNSFIDKSAIALVGIPRVPCPKCKKESQEDIEAHPWIIPLNPVRLFFRLRDRKLQLSIPN